MSQGDGMKNQVLRSLFVCAALIAALMVMTMTAPGQAPAPLPRAADGHPRIAGVWQSGGVSLLGEKGAPPKVAPQPVTIRLPRREPLSYQPWALEKQKTLTR